MTPSPDTTPGADPNRGRAAGLTHVRADGTLPKGDALAVARIAGIMGAKKTPELIPLCHPLPLAKATVDFEPDAAAGTVRILATVKTRGVTGVEMEALTAATVAALTLYDMTKAVDKHAAIGGIRVLAKTGGKSGDWSIAPVPLAAAEHNPPKETTA